MDALPLTLVLSINFGWCLLARLLQGAGLTAPIVFVAAGFVLAEGLGILDLTRFRGIGRLYITVAEARRFLASATVTREELRSDG